MDSKEPSDALTLAVWTLSAWYTFSRRPHRTESGSSFPAPPRTLGESCVGQELLSGSLRGEAEGTRCTKKLLNYVCVLNQSPLGGQCADPHFTKGSQLEVEGQSVGHLFFIIRHASFTNCCSPFTVAFNIQHPHLVLKNHQMSTNSDSKCTQTKTELFE